MGEDDRPLLDILLDRDRLRGRIVDRVRHEVTTHVTGNLLDKVVRPRVDQILGKERRR